MVGLDTFHGFSQLGLRILDDVALVENAIVPLDSLQILDVVADHLIRGYYDVVLGEFWEKAATVAGVAGVHDWAQVLGVLENLIVPVTGQSRWTDDQRREVDRVGGFGLPVLLGTFVMLAGQDAD